MSTAATIGLWVGVGCVCVILAASLVFLPRMRSAWRRRSRQPYKLSE
jgi:hypothetical protein